MLLTDEQIAKGVNFTLSVKDFPELDEDSSPFLEACKTFPWFFMETFQKVRDIDGKTKPFRLTKVQRYLERKCFEQQKHHKYVHLIVLKGRQYRVSTYFARRGFHFSTWHSHIYTILANRVEDVAEEGIFGYVNEGLESLKEQAEYHQFLQPLIKTSREKIAGALIQFDGLSKGKIEVRTANKGAVGRPCQFAHITEASRIDRFGEFWDAFYQALHISAFHHMIIESTAHFHHPEFMEIFNDQWDLEHETGQIPALRAIFLPPYMVDEYMNYEIPDDYTWEKFWSGENENVYGCEREIATQKWWDDYDQTYIELPLEFMKWRRDMIQGQKREEMAGFSKLDIFKQNFPMTKDEAELSIADNVFDRKILEKRRYEPYIIVPKYGCMDLSNEDKPDFTPTLSDYMQVWSYPEEGYWYTLGIDPAGSKDGKTGDYHVGVVWSPINNEIAAMFRSNNWTIHNLVEVSIAVARYYNSAIIAYEANYHGQHILQKFLAKDSYIPRGAPYTNLYTRREPNKKMPNQPHNPLVGFWSDIRTKPALVGILQDLIYDDETGLYSSELINELWFWKQSLNKDGERTKTPKAPKGKHDDIIIATGIAVYVAREFIKRKDLKKKLQVSTAFNPYDDYEALRKEKRQKRDEDRTDSQWEKEVKRMFRNSGIRVR